MPDFTHIDSEGKVRMVDVSEKKQTARIAVASGKVIMNFLTLKTITEQKAKKGNVLETARIAGIMGAKKTAELIPLCHPLNVSYISIDFFPEFTKEKGIINIKSSVSLFGQTGVEMEALTGVSAAALTIYDMCKAYDKNMIISDIMLLEKTGGKSGIYKRKTK
ncbi:MAG: cyclic pyranopterin monophosphate synthase MoaC [Deltaproteobacteria bacterium]|nr:cyclic pyranopterin monophosphate synthase MoaC [Deltaproteobacteria bacterium]